MKVAGGGRGRPRGGRGVMLEQAGGWAHLVVSALHDKRLQLGLVGKEHLEHFPHGGLGLCQAQKQAG